MIHALVSMAIEGIANRAELAFLGRANLDGKVLEKCLRDLDRLPPLPALAPKIDRFERVQCLNVVFLVDRVGIKYLERLASSSTKPVPDNPLTEGLVEGSNWDLALRNINWWFDRIAAALAQSDRGSRAKTIDQIEKDLQEYKKKTVASENLADLLIGDDSAKGKVVGDLVICLFVPAVTKVQTAADKTQQSHKNVLAAFALAWYHADHGRYPKELSDLAPKYLAEIPQDIFSGKPLIYRLTDKGYLLYSVGPNGQDDGGRGPEDDPRGDDIAVRIPLPEVPKK